jgi:cell shape-determining protein MreD
MPFDIINLTKIRRAILYIAALLICVTVQNSVFSRISPPGARPMFIPCFVIAVAVFEGGIWGGVFGLLTGILLDIQLIESVVLFTIALPILGFAGGVVMERFMNRRFFSYFCFCAAALSVCALLQCVNLLLFVESTDKARILLVAALQTLWSLPFTFAVYYPCRAIGRYGRDKNKERK